MHDVLALAWWGEIGCNRVKREYPIGAVGGRCEGVGLGGGKDADLLGCAGAWVVPPGPRSRAGQSCKIDFGSLRRLWEIDQGVVSIGVAGSVDVGWPIARVGAQQILVRNAREEWPRLDQRPQMPHLFGAAPCNCLSPVAIGVVDDLALGCVKLPHRVMPVRYATRACEDAAVALLAHIVIAKVAVCRVHVGQGLTGWSS